MSVAVFHADDSQMKPGLLPGQRDENVRAIEIDEIGPVLMRIAVSERGKENLGDRIRNVTVGHQLTRKDLVFARVAEQPAERFARHGDKQSDRRHWRLAVQFEDLRQMNPDQILENEEALGAIRRFCGSWHLARSLR